ncbi:MAG: carboxypeptidase-like regulatory domain-containing protein [Anaerolineae bacterium]
MKSKYLSPLHRLGLTLLLAFGLILAAVAVVAAQGGTISGTVTSPNGYPLPGGTLVKLFEPDGETVFGQATPDSNDGSFSLGPVPNGLYVLKAIPPAGSGLTQSLPKLTSVINGPVNVGSLALTTPQITGTVTAPDGLTPVTATVKVLLGNGQTFQSVPAPGGAFLAGGLPAGSYGLRAEPATSDPYWNSELQTVTIGGPGQAVTLTLTNADLWGVTKDNLGNPVADATVHAIGLAAPHQHQTDHSNADGFWAIGGLNQASYLVAAEPPADQGGLVPPAPFTVAISGATNPYTLTFSSPPKVVSGVVKTNTNLPVENALVLARRVDMHGQASALTGADGGYQLDLSPGLWALTVEAITNTTPSDWVNPLPPQLVHFQHNLQAEHKTQNFTVLTADSTVTGQVELPGGGTPAFTVTVALHNSEGIGRRTNIDASGAFTLPVPHGGYKVAVLPHDPGYLGPPVEPIRVPPNSTFDLGTLTLIEKDAAITGTVRDESGAGVEGIPVAARRPGLPGTLHTETGPDGVYLLAVTGGTWGVQPAPGPDDPYLYTGGPSEVEVTAGQTVTGVDFSLTDANAIIHGQLVDENNQPVGDAEGWAEAAQSGNPALHNGAPIQAGTFDIFVPGGTYNVVAHLPAGSPYMSSGARSVTVADSGQVTITLEVQTKDAAIEGALWDPRSQSVVSGVSGVVGAWADGNWAATHIDAGNGTYHLEVAPNLWHLGYRIDPDSGYVKLVENKNVPVQSGQTAQVTLPVLPRDGTIRGVVLDPAGSPLPGATVFAAGAGDTVQNVWLKTYSRENGAFDLAVPHGLYKLGATAGLTDVIKPALQPVNVPANGVSDGHVLQFHTPDATISGNLTISGTSTLNGQAVVWGWSRDGGTVRGRFPVTNSAGLYSLDVVSNTTWHLGAAFETSTQYWFGRATVTLGQGNATQDLVLNGPHPKPAPVIVTFDANQPQRINLADGTHIFIPGGAMPVSGTVTLQVVPIATLPHQQHANVYKYGYAFLASDSQGQPIEQNFNQEVIIGFTYSEAELLALGIPEAALKPAYFSTTTNEWTFPESYAVDTETNVVTMQIDHFTDFALTSGEMAQVYLPLITR